MNAPFTISASPSSIKVYDSLTTQVTITVNFATGYSGTVNVTAGAGPFTGIASQVASSGSHMQQEPTAPGGTIFLAFNVITGTRIRERSRSGFSGTGRQCERSSRRHQHVVCREFAVYGERALGRQPV